MEKFKCFWIDSIGGSQFYRCRNGKLYLVWDGKESGFYGEAVVSGKLRNVIEKLDRNGLVKLQKAETEDGIDRDLYIIKEVPSINCLDLTNCIFPLMCDKCYEEEWETGVEKLYSSFTIESKDSKEYLAFIEMLNSLPEITMCSCKVNELGNIYWPKVMYYPYEICFLHDCRVKSDLLDKYGSPLFMLPGSYNGLMCTAEFIRECRKEGLEPFHLAGFQLDKNGEPERLTVSAKKISSKLKVPEMGQLPRQFNGWLDEVISNAKKNKYKSILFGLFESEEGYRLYTAGAYDKSFGWEEETEEPFSYFEEAISSNYSCDDMLAITNYLLANSKDQLKGFKILFGFDDGDVYAPKLFKKK